MTARPEGNRAPGSQPGPSRLVTLAEAASYLATTVWAIRNLLWDGSLPYVKLGRRFLVDVRDLDRLVEGLKQREQP